MIEVDIHLHTMASSCSEMSVDKLAEMISAAKRQIATVTDHGSIEGCRRLRDLLPDVLIVFGIEVTAEEGDFLIYSPDEDYLASLSDRIDSVQELRRDEQTAIIWAHPRVSQRARGWEAPRLPDVTRAVPFIDGLEVFNGTMLTLHKEGILQRDYFSNLVRIGINYGLAMTGGSDAHELETVLHAGTIFPSDVKDAASFVAALKGRKVHPIYDRDFFEVSVSLSG